MGAGARWPDWSDTARRAVEAARATPERRLLSLWILGFLGAFLAGYLVAALVLFPAPFFSATKPTPRLLGLEQPDAEATLSQAGFDVGDVERITHPSAARGQVVWQDPPPGVGVPEGTAVTLWVSIGPQRVPVPDLAGYDEDLARRLIEAAGLRVDRVESTQAPLPRGVVVATRPSAGATITPGGAVTLVVSVGAPTITVPDLTGLTREEAGAALARTELQLGRANQRTSLTATAGTVIAQDPAPGTLTAPGTVVNVVLARRGFP